jgi:putative DNA primase/helicase
MTAADGDADLRGYEEIKRRHAANGSGDWKSGRRVLIKRGSGYQMRKISWAWPGWLALGKLHVLGGQKGAGKSSLAFDLLAQITSGGKWPDGTSAPLGDVLIWSGEDDIEDTILPRFAVAGGNRDRVCFIEGVIVDDVKRAFDPAIDMANLIDTMRDLPDLVAVLIDPIVSATMGDSHKNSETRRGLQPVVDLAVERNIAVIGITHFAKGTQGKDPIERIAGSLAFGAIPRVVWGAAKGDGEDGPRRLIRIASNIGQTGGGFEYLLRQDLLLDHDFTAQRIVWGKRLEGSPLDLLENAQEKSKKIEAVALLDTILVNGPIPVKDIKDAATANGISWPTIERAKATDKTILTETAAQLRAIGLLRDDKDSGWYWRKKRPSNGGGV